MPIRQKYFLKYSSALNNELNSERAMFLFPRKSFIYFTNIIIYVCQYLTVLRENLYFIGGTMGAVKAVKD